MGRYFKAQQVELNRDFIYQPPIDLMAKVIQGKDLAVDKYNEYQASIDDKIKAEGLKADEPRLKEIINDYHSKIDDLAKTVQSDPLAASKQMNAIKNLGRSIADNWNQGEVAKIQGNKQLRDKAIAEDLARIKQKEGRVLQEDVDRITSYYDNQFKGTNYESPNKYNQYQYEKTASYFDINDFLDKHGEGFKADETGTKYDKVNGEWVKTVGSKTEKVDYDEVKSALGKMLTNDTEFQNYYKQQLKHGFITPEQYTKKISDSIDGYSDKYAYKKTSTESSLNENGNFWKWKEWNKAAEAEKAAALAEVNKDASEIYNNSVAVRHFENDYLDKLKANVNPALTKNINNIDDFIKVLSNSKDKNSAFVLKKLAEAQQIQGMVKNSMKASYAGYYNIPGMTEAGVEKIRKGQNEHLLANGQSYKFRMPPIEIINKDGSRQNLTLKNGYQEFTPKNMVGKNVRTPDGRLVQVKNVSPVDNSIIPILLNGINNNKSINDNDAHATLKFTVYDPKTKQEESFTRTAYYNMAEAEGLSLK